MSRLQQYRIAGNGTLVGTTLVTTSDPPQNFSDQSVANLVTSLIGSAGFPNFSTDDQLLYCVVMPKGTNPGGKSFYRRTLQLHVQRQLRIRSLRGA